MPRGPRKQSESGIYHVFSRGVGHQRLFEDEKDRAFFLDTLGRLLNENGGDLYAWVLMENHFHLLLRMPIDVLSNVMRSLQTAYALHFNVKHDHDGHLFKGRFGSQPIESDEQLLACVRYIHHNPAKAGMALANEYKWSSYRSYIQGAAVTNTDFVLNIIGGIGRFVEFHQLEDDGRFVFLDIERPSVDTQTRKLSDSQVDEEASAMFGNDWRETLLAISKQERNARLRQLKNAGISVSQLQRLTGIGRNIISRA